VAVEPGFDEERQVGLRHLRGNEQGSCPDALGGTAGARQGPRQLGALVGITQSNSHDWGIGSRGPEADYRSG
jgi:hypothetical protein